METACRGQWFKQTRCSCRNLSAIISSTSCPSSHKAPPLTNTPKFFYMFCFSTISYWPAFTTQSSTKERERDRARDRERDKQRNLPLSETPYERGPPPRKKKRASLGRGRQSGEFALQSQAERQREGPAERGETAQRHNVAGERCFTWHPLHGVFGVVTRQPLYQEVAVLVEVGGAPCRMWERDWEGESPVDKEKARERKKERKISATILVCSFVLRISLLFLQKLVQIIQLSLITLKSMLADHVYNQIIPIHHTSYIVGFIYFGLHQHEMKIDIYEF